MYSLAAFLLLGVSLRLADAELRPYDVTAENLFDIYDIDKDSEFSLAELKISFQGFDPDFDGVSTLNEFITYFTKQNRYLFVLTRALYDIYDTDQNGVLTEYDFNEVYKLWDANENNVVSKLEFVHWWTVTLEALDHLHHPDA